MENIFLQKTSEVRSTETNYILKCCYVVTVFRFTLPMGNAASLILFMYYYFRQGGVLDVSSSTVLLRIVSYLDTSLGDFPIAMTGLGEMLIGSRRLTAFLKSEELEIPLVKKPADETSENALQIIDGGFYWDHKVTKEESAQQKKDEEKQEKIEVKKKEKNKKKEDKQKSKKRQIQSVSNMSLLTNDESANLSLKESLILNLPSDKEEDGRKEAKTESNFKLQNLNFRAKKGELTIVIGKIGSGKSSLLMALLGEMRVSDVKRT